MRASPALSPLTCSMTRREMATDSELFYVYGTPDKATGLGLYSYPSAFSGDYARQNHQLIYYLTERALFRLGPHGLILEELAPGLDLERDVLAQMAFRPEISPHLRTMDSKLFCPEPLGLARASERSLSDRQRRGCMLVNSALELAPHDAGATRVWVLPLDLTLPPAFVAALLRRLPARSARQSPPVA